MPRSLNYGATFVGEQPDTDHMLLTVEPKHGKPFKMEVRPVREPRRGRRVVPTEYVFCRAGNAPYGPNYGTYKTFDRAVTAMFARGRKYARLCRNPIGKVA